MAVRISFPISVPFSEWVTSAEHCWITLAARRSLARSPGLCIGIKSVWFARDPAWVSSSVWMLVTRPAANSSNVSLNGGPNMVKSVIPFTVRIAWTSPGRAAPLGRPEVYRYEIELQLVLVAGQQERLDGALGNVRPSRFMVSPGQSVISGGFPCRSTSDHSRLSNLPFLLAT